MPLLIILTSAILIVVSPILVIWAINTLFGMGIEFTIWTWLAVVILASATRAKVTVDRSS